MSARTKARPTYNFTLSLGRPEEDLDSRASGTLFLSHAQIVANGTLLQPTLNAQGVVSADP